MATSKIRGITIELGADTSGLKKALGDVNKEIGSTQRELKDVDRLLKLDPSNTELLAQKQRMLQDAVSETKTKLEALKGAQEDIERAYQNGDIDQGQYDAFQREIISVENELKNLEKRAAESNVALQKIANVGDKMKTAGDKISSVGSSLTKNVTTPILGIGAAIVKTTADFDSQMMKVKAIAGDVSEDAIGGIVKKAEEMGLEFERSTDATETAFNALRAKAREMANSTKFTATEVGQGFEYMAMAGWKTEEMLDGISGVLNLAAASGSELGITSDIVTDALTAFGEGADQAGRYADILAAASSNANTNVEMMGETLKYAATPAATLGYSMEDIAIASGLMANAGTKASMAGTTLRNIFQRMAKTTKESAMAMDRLGITLADETTGEMYSFRDIMEQLRESFGHINMPIDEFNSRIQELDEALDDGSLTQSKYDKEVEELIKQAYGAEKAEKARAAAMLGGSRAMSGLLGIVNASDEDFNKMTQAIDNSAGSAEHMAEIMQSSTSGKMEILISKLQDLAISFGDILIPVIDQVVEYLQKLTDKFNSLDDDTKEMIVKFAAIAAAVGPVLIVFGKLTTGIGTLLSLATKLGPVLSVVGKGIGLLVSPVGLVVAAIIGLIAIFAKFGDEIQGYLQKADDFLQNIFAKDFTEVFGPVLGGIINNFMSTFKNQWDAFKKVLDGVIDIVRGIFTQDWERAWKGVKEIFTGIFDSFVGIAKSPLNGVISLLNGLINKVNSFIEKINSISITNPFSGEKVGVNIPTIPNIPMLAKGGKVLDGSAIVGEAGAEMINVNHGAATVTPLTNSGGAGGSDISGLLEKYLPYLANNQSIYLDGKALVGGIIDDVNNQLGVLSQRGAYR